MHFSTFVVFLFLGLTRAAVEKRAASPTYCYRNNCFRAVAGTRIPDHQALASIDCKSALAVTTVSVAIPTYASVCSDFARYASACSCLGVVGGNFTQPVTTASEYIATTAPVISATSKPGNSTGSLSSASVISSSKLTLPPFVNSTSTSAILPSLSSHTVANSTTTPQTSSHLTISTSLPLGAISSSPSVLPSSTSSLISSILPPITSSSSSLLLPPSTSTIPSSTKSTSTISSVSPSCTNTLTDPLNCGTCGTVCGSGTCENGVCTSSQCTAQKCGGFVNCNENSNCFCFSSTRGTNGFCGSNAVCSTLTACANDEQCNVVGSTGNICAVSTCCPQQSNIKPGVCLQGQCGNPGAKLMMMAKARMLQSRTAAF